MTIDRTGWLMLAACMISTLIFIAAEHMAKIHKIDYGQARRLKWGGFYLTFLICGLLAQLLAYMD